MDTLDRKTFTTSRDLTYTYYHTPNASNNGKPTLLLQHGFPDDHNLWAGVLPDLLKLEYPILIPDLLGYNGTSKPSDPALYNSKGMTSDIREILDHENIEAIVSIGHDWGSFHAQRMYMWHPERVVGLLLLNIAYMPPAGPFDLAAANDMMEKDGGLPRLAYWELFTAPDGAEIIESHLESVYTAFFGAPEGCMEQLFCHRGAFRDFIVNDKQMDLKPFAKDPVFKDEWFARFKRDGFKGPLNWYFAHKDNHHWAVEKDIPKERFVVKVPVLFIGATQDSVGRTELIWPPWKAGLLPDLVVEEIETGHWQTYEVPDRTGSIMVNWLKEKDFT